MSRAQEITIREEIDKCARSNHLFFFIHPFHQYSDNKKLTEPMRTKNQLFGELMKVFQPR